MQNRCRPDATLLWSITLIKARTILWLKIAASVALVVIIAISADWPSVWETLKQANRQSLAIVLTLMTLCVVYSAYKWWLLLRLHNAPYRFLDLCRWYFIAMLFNNFLPTSIGGDGFRVYRTFDNNRSRATALVAVFVERISGILSLLAVGWIAAITHSLQTGHALSSFIAWSGLGVFVVGVVVLIVVTVFGLYDKLLRWRRLPDKLKQVIAHVQDYSDRPMASIWALVGVSIGFHIVSIAWMTLLARAVGADIGLVELAVVAALVSAVTVLPLSINGIGLVDGSFIFLASQYGMDPAQGLGFMLVQRVFLLPVSLIGLIFYWRDSAAENG